MLSLLALSQAAAAAAPPPSPPAQEIVVTAKHDKCFVQYGQHPVSDEKLQTLSQSWALGTPVRVIEPRGASLKCEFQIMQTLAKHGQHMAQFVARSEDLSAQEEKEEQTEGAKEQAAAKPAPPPSAPAPAVLPPPVTVADAAPVRRRGRHTAPARVVGQASSGLVTLSCTMADPARPYQLDVIVNEEKGTVTPSRPDTGGGSEMKAVFMPDAVRFGPFTINRTTLRIQRQNGGNTTAAAKEPPVVDGQCALAELHRVF